MDYYVSRQPVLDQQYRTVAYSLSLQSPEGIRNASANRETTATVLARSLTEIGLHKLSSNKPIYISASSEFLENPDNIPPNLPPGALGLEVSTHTTTGDKFLTSCRKLKEQGHVLLLDGFSKSAVDSALLDLADIVVLDIHDGHLGERALDVHRASLSLMVRNVDTLEDHNRATGIGARYFQGYFFLQPQIIEGKKLPDSRLAIMHAMQKATAADSIEDVEKVISQDMALSYRLLKYINSAAIGLPNRINSIQQALSLLGLNAIRQWLAMLLLASLGDEKPPELVQSAVLRGRILEGMARLESQARGADHFILGLFSLLDTFLGQSLESILEDVLLPDDIHEGLVNPESHLGRRLAIAKAMEKGNWTDVATLCNAWDGWSLQCDDLLPVYIEALHWLNENSELFGDAEA